jgi:hypothetical protein
MAPQHEVTDGSGNTTEVKEARKRQRKTDMGLWKGKGTHMIPLASVSTLERENQVGWENYGARDNMGGAWLDVGGLTLYHIMP